MQTHTSLTTPPIPPSITALACAVLTTVACASASQPTDRGSVAVILDPQDVDTPPSRDKVCRYSSKMIATCEFQLVLLKYPDPEAAIAEIGAAYTASQARESARTRDCLNRAMTAGQSRQAWTCLESVTDCSQLSRCVGSDYQGN